MVVLFFLSHVYQGTRKVLRCQVRAVQVLHGEMGCCVPVTALSPECPGLCVLSVLRSPILLVFMSMSVRFSLYGLV